MHALQSQTLQKLTRKIDQLAEENKSLRSKIHCIASRLLAQPRGTTNSPTPLTPPNQLPSFLTPNPAPTEQTALRSQIEPKDQEDDGMSFDEYEINSPARAINCAKIPETKQPP